LKSWDIIRITTRIRKTAEFDDAGKIQMEESMNMHESIPIGIIGTGSIANNIHLPGLAEMEHVSIEAVCDMVEERAEETARKYKVSRWYSNYRQMLAEEKLRAVLVLVQPDQAFRIILDCLEQGLDIFVEKPAGITAYQTKTLAKKAREKGCIVQVGYNRRYIPLVQEVVRIMRETTTITQVEGCFFKNSSAEFYDGCTSAHECDVVHAIDLVRWIAGGSPKAAATLIGQYNSPVPNSWNSIIKFDNDVTGIIKSNYQTGGRVHSFEIHGYTASAYINLGFAVPDCDARIIFHMGKQSYSAASAGTGSDEVVYYDGKKMAGSEEYHKYYGYYNEVRQFINCVRTREDPETNLYDSVHTMELVEMLANSVI
jgi:virulence factor